jgi:hypothetical protein
MKSDQPFGNPTAVSLINPDAASFAHSSGEESFLATIPQKRPVHRQGTKSCLKVKKGIRHLRPYIRQQGTKQGTKYGKILLKI